MQCALRRVVAVATAAAAVNANEQQRATAA